MSPHPSKPGGDFVEFAIAARAEPGQLIGGRLFIRKASGGAGTWFIKPMPARITYAGTSPTLAMTADWGEVDFAYSGTGDTGWTSVTFGNAADRRVPECANAVLWLISGVNASGDTHIDDLSLSTIG